MLLFVTYTYEISHHLMAYVSFEWVSRRQFIQKRITKFHPALDPDTSRTAISCAAHLFGTFRVQVARITI